jgi:hypothetical protein
VCVYVCETARDLDSSSGVLVGLAGAASIADSIQSFII